MSRTPIDLSSHINRSVTRGHPANFPVVSRPIEVVPEAPAGAPHPIPNRKAIVREDTGDVLAVVSDRYQLVPHQRILDLVDAAISPLDISPVPRGLFVDRRGARMRALYKFPTLSKPVVPGDAICPCLKIQNTYDGSSRISIVIGAFRFVCTNLAVGGGGAFAGGFVSIHAGEIPIERVTGQLASYLAGFDAIVDLYREWCEIPVNPPALIELLQGFPKSHAETLTLRLAERNPRTAFDAYNVLTSYATHETRRARIAFDLLERANRHFQHSFVASPPASIVNHAATAAG